MRWTWLLLAMMACKPEETDTSGDTDTDTGDTDTDTDTQVACTDFEFGGSLDIPDHSLAPAGTVTVGLFPFEFVDNPTWNATFATTTLDMPAVGASGDFAFCVPAIPGDEWFQDIDDTAGDARAALFFIGAWYDDGDGTFQVGEELVGGTLMFAGYLDGTIPPDVDALGGEVGWNMVHFDIANMDGGPSAITPFQSGFDGVVLPGNLLMNDRTELEGSISPSGLGTEKVGLFSAYEMLEIPVPADPLLSSVDVDVSSPGAAFTLPVTDPPADHLTTDLGDAGGGGEAAVYYAVAWEDLDEDGAYDEGTETPHAMSIAAGTQSRLVAWIHPTDFTAVFFGTVFGGVGWQLLEVPAQDQPPVPADWDAGIVLGDQFN